MESTARIPWPSAFESVLGTYLLAAPPPGEMTPELSLSGAGLDSVTTIALMIELEERFGFTFSDDLLTAETFETPGALGAAIASLGGA